MARSPGLKRKYGRFHGARSGGGVKDGFPKVSDKVVEPLDHVLMQRAEGGCAHIGEAAAPDRSDLFRYFHRARHEKDEILLRHGFLLSFRDEFILSDEYLSTECLRPFPTIPQSRVTWDMSRRPPLRQRH